MSSIDHKKLREDMIEKIVEENIAKTKPAAKKKLAAFEKKWEKKLPALTNDARLRIIAIRELNMQLRSEGEFSEQEPIQRTIGSLNVKEFRLVITAKVIKKVMKDITLGTGEEKRIAELTVTDNTGELQVGLWEENATWAENDITEGDIIRIHGGYTDESKSKWRPYDFKISKKGRVELLDRDSVQFPTLESQSVSISQLRDNMNNIIFTGKVTKMFEPREKSGGGQWMSISVVDKDGSSIYIKIWDDSIINILNGPRFNEGDVVTFTNLRASTYKGNIGLNTGYSTTVTKAEEEDASEYKRIMTKTGANSVTQLVAAQEGDTVECVIKILDIYPQKPFYDSCPNSSCKKGIRQDENTKEYYCPNGHTDISENDPVPVARCSGMCTDGTASFKFGSMDKIAEQILGMEAAQLKSEFLDLQRSSREEDEKKKMRDAAKVFINAYSSEALQGFYRVRCKVRIDKDYEGNIEIMINEINPANYEEEAEYVKSIIVEMVKEA